MRPQNFKRLDSARRQESPHLLRSKITDGFPKAVVSSALDYRHIRGRKRNGRLWLAMPENLPFVEPLLSSQMIQSGLLCCMKPPESRERAFRMKLGADHRLRDLD